MKWVSAKSNHGVNSLHVVPVWNTEYTPRGFSNHGFKVQFYYIGMFI